MSDPNLISSYRFNPICQSGLSSKNDIYENASDLDKKTHEASESIFNELEQSFNRNNTSLFDKSFDHLNGSEPLEKLENIYEEDSLEDMEFDSSNELTLNEDGINIDSNEIDFFSGSELTDFLNNDLSLEAMMESVMSKLYSGEIENTEITDNISLIEDKENTSFVDDFISGYLAFSESEINEFVNNHSENLNFESVLNLTTFDSERTENIKIENDTNDFFSFIDFTNNIINFESSVEKISSSDPIEDFPSLYSYIDNSIQYDLFSKEIEEYIFDKTSIQIDEINELMEIHSNKTIDQLIDGFFRKDGKVYHKISETSVIEIIGIEKYPQYNIKIKKEFDSLDNNTKLLLSSLTEKNNIKKLYFSNIIENIKQKYTIFIYSYIYSNNIKILNNNDKKDKKIDEDWLKRVLNNKYNTKLDLAKTKKRSFIDQDSILKIQAEQQTTIEEQKRKKLKLKHLEDTIQKDYRKKMDRIEQENKENKKMKLEKVYRLLKEDLRREVINKENLDFEFKKTLYTKKDSICIKRIRN